MSEIRCLECGSSRLDPQGYKCGRCGKAIGLRSERCYVTDETKHILMNHSSALSKFGIELKSGQPLGKSADAVLAAAILILHCADSFDHGALHRLVQYLKEIRIEREEILRLRLDEPEKILAYYDMNQDAARTVAKPQRKDYRQNRRSPGPTGSGGAGQRKKKRQPRKRVSKRR